MIDEGPSSEDLDRFGGETAYCPECGAEIWDEAEACPKCHAYVGGNASSRPPIEAGFQRRWMIIVAMVALIAFLIIVLR